MKSENQANEIIFLT